MKSTTPGLIMLIDDNPTDRFVHRKLLQIHGLCDDVIEFEGAREALNYFRQQENPAIPDIILLDIMMPDMDGFAFLVHFANFSKSLQKKPLIFMLSSSDDDKDIQRVRNNPQVEKLLRKPFSPATLKKYLSEL